MSHFTQYTFMSQYIKKVTVFKIDTLYPNITKLFTGVHALAVPPTSGKCNAI